MYCINVKRKSPCRDKGVPRRNEDSVISHWGLLEGELSVKDKLQIF